ncbi:MAG: hypothetical protein XE11_0349 [Methanomicrobiales archaeon 53_19]|nr:MAG: hypothetical protein XE11_0349 [Methanomicrobiales archaeon 53_19]
MCTSDHKTIDQGYKEHECEEQPLMRVYKFFIEDKGVESAGYSCC